MEGGKLMMENERKLVEQVHRQAIAEMGPCQMRPEESRTLDCMELPEAKPDDPIGQEWNYYRREVGRLLDEGHEGRWILIKGEETIGIWNTQDEAHAVSLAKFLMQNCLIHQILRREPLIKMSWRFWGWRG